MFFSEDLLSSKKGSFGIVWLAATLGPRTKRITRKQLTSVDLNKTCELIAEPPEPMALRLSGCLLVGVARVYHQNYDLFYSASDHLFDDTRTPQLTALQDVAKFHSDLRRMVMTEFGGHAGPNGQPIGLDLAGDGKSRHDQITFGGEDVSWLTGIDLELFKMDWRAPERVSRKRQHSTQLSSLHSQQSLDPNRPSQLDSDEDDDEDEHDSDVEVESEEGRERKRKRVTSSPFGRRKRNTGTAHPVSSQDGFNDVLPDIEDLLPELTDMPSSDNGLPLPVPASDLVEPVEPQIPDTEFVPDQPFTFPDNIVPPVPLTPQRDRDAQEKSSSEQDGHGGAKKAKKAKKLKKAQVDIDLEMEDDEWRGRTYKTDMIRQRAELKAKDRAKVAEERANALLDGAGLWVDAFDSDLNEMLAICARPPKFKWETAARNNEIAKMVQPQQNEDAQAFPEMVNDVFNNNDFGYPDTTYMENYHDTEVPIHDVTGREASQKPESEVGRRASPAPALDSQAVLPWSEAIDDDFDDYSAVDPPSSPVRLSTMTPLEKRLRSSGLRGVLTSRERRERSASVPGQPATGVRPLVSDEDARDVILPEDPFATQDMPQSQMRDDLPHAFQPNMLATLEMQFTEKKMRQAEVDEIDFDQIIDVGLSKKVAALAFYNCLTLTTKSILAVAQPVPWDTITVRFTADL